MTSNLSNTLEVDEGKHNKKKGCYSDTAQCEKERKRTKPKKWKKKKTERQIGKEIGVFKVGRLDVR